MCSAEENSVEANQLVKLRIQGGNVRYVAPMYLYLYRVVETILTAKHTHFTNFCTCVRVGVVGATLHGSYMFHLRISRYTVETSRSYVVPHLF